MATVTTENANITYVLKLNEREANALTELLRAVSFDEGEGHILDGIYLELCDAGAESEAVLYSIEDDTVIVEREDEE